MKSRYVFTCKPIEDFALEDAKSSDIILDFNANDGPTKAKCRHVMMGFSEPDLLSLETSTTQVHRDSVVFATQISASKGWQPGYADFTQAFHSGDAINRELYAELPREGIPGVEPTQLIKLKKTCYGLTDGPSACSPRSWDTANPSLTHVCSSWTRRTLLRTTRNSIEHRRPGYG